MPFRQIDIPSLHRRLSNIMACPSSAPSLAHEPALEEYHRLGGNCLHLHGERGETHSRQSVGQWLKKHNLRSEFFLCTQICHEGWDAVAKRAIDRLTPEAVVTDIAADLALIGTDHLDFVYVANPPRAAVEPVLDAIARELASGRIRAFGVRNWTTAAIKSAHSYLVRIGAPGISAVVTTELSLPSANCPLWPEDVPFAQIEPAVRKLGLAVFAHADDFNMGQFLFDDEAGEIHPRWLKRWEHPANRAIARFVRQFAAARSLTPLEVNLAWLLNRPFPAIALISPNNLPSGRTEQLERASQLLLEPADLSR